MDDEIEFYIVRRKPLTRELVAAINLSDGGCDYYLISSDGATKTNSKELMNSFMGKNVHPKIKKIEGIERFLGELSNVRVSRIETNILENQIFCDRIASLVDQSLEQEQEKNKYKEMDK